MASTYSNLKIQLMTTGENATTWGNVTNVNLGTAIEEAIVGSASVTFASDNQTLTLTDTNATQTARHLRLLCGGTTGGSTRNLVVPSIEKPYIVQNNCADSILVKTSAGSGITVPAGKTMWVYSNGTDVVNVTTHLTSLTLGTALAVADGGTGSNTASGARTNLGLGSMSTQNASAVAITGGSITGITDLAVADGGTGASTASGARTNLGATTIGANLFTLSDPSAVTFPRFNADNTISALDAATFRSAIGAGTSSTTGTVTSVSGTGTVNGLTLTGTVTASGNLTLGGTLSGVSLTTQVTDTLPIGNGGTGATTAGGARTALGSTTLGDNLFTITNPSAITFPRFNANNTVSALSAADFRTAIGAGTGTVTSVGGTGTVNGITLTGTVSSSGNLTLGGTLSGVSLTTQVSGTLPVANGGTGLNATPTNGQIDIGNGSGFTRTTITAGSGISVTNGAGSITIAATGGGGSGTVTSVNGSGGTTGLTLTGGPITTSGTLTLGGTLAVANGGTGSTTASAAATALGLGTSSNVQHGSLGIGTAASGTTGEIRATNNITAYYSSDIRFKENIADIQGALDAVQHIGGKTFDWTDEYIADHGGADGYFVRKQDFGVIAQDVQEVFPLAVRQREDGSLAVDYEKLVALAFRAINELRAEVEKLKNDA